MKQSMIYMQTIAVQTGLPLSKVEAAMVAILDSYDRISRDNTSGWASFRNGQASMLETLGAGHYTIDSAFQALIDERKEAGQDDNT